MSSCSYIHTYLHIHTYMHNTPRCRAARGSRRAPSPHLQHVYACMHVCMHMRICSLQHVYACMYVYVCMHVCICTYVCMHACMHVCTCVYVACSTFTQCTPQLVHSIYMHPSASALNMYAHGRDAYAWGVECMDVGGMHMHVVLRRWCARGRGRGRRGSLYACRVEALVRTGSWKG